MECNNGLRPTPLAPPPAMAAEVMAARVEGLLRADPVLGQFWRMAASFTEAAASVSLDHTQVPEAAIFMRQASNDSSWLDARGVDMATQIRGLLSRPPDLFADPVATIRRIEAAARPIGEVVDTTDQLEDEETLDLVERIKPWMATPLLASMRGAAIYGHATRRASPAAERLLFMVIENAARHLDVTGSPKRAGALTEDERPELRPVKASWIITPAAALTRGGFRIWSPLSNHNVFFAAVTAQLQRELGALGQIRADLARLEDAAQNAHGRSRIADFVALIHRNPILTSGEVVRQLGVTRKTALAILTGLEGQGALVNFAARRTARLWTIPTLAGRMMIRKPMHAKVQHISTGAEVSGAGEIIQSHIRGQFDQQQLEDILAGLDQAMANVDRVMEDAGRSRETND